MEKNNNEKEKHMEELCVFTLIKKYCDTDIAEIFQIFAYHHHMAAANIHTSANETRGAHFTHACFSFLNTQNE